MTANQWLLFVGVPSPDRDYLFGLGVALEETRAA